MYLTWICSMLVHKWWVLKLKYDGSEMVGLGSWPNQFTDASPHFPSMAMLGWCLGNNPDFIKLGGSVLGYCIPLRSVVSLLTCLQQPLPLHRVSLNVNHLRALVCIRGSLTIGSIEFSRPSNGNRTRQGTELFLGTLISSLSSPLYSRSCIISFD